jgi:hypothetical protein
LAKKPSFKPTRAEACVMLLRKPSLTVTGELPPAFELVVAEPDDEDEDEEQPASNKAAPIIAAPVTRRI